MTETFTDASLGAVQECPENNEPTWLEIELLDASGTPVAAHAFVLEQPEGHALSQDGATLDEQGRARFSEEDEQSLLPASCTLVFLDPPASAPTVAGEAHWFRITLTNDGGQPAAEWRFQVFEPGSDHRLAQGSLDHLGQALVPLGDEVSLDVAFEAPTSPTGTQAAAPDEQWLQLELLDDSNSPASAWRFRAFEANQEEPCLIGTFSDLGRALAHLESATAIDLEVLPPAAPAAPQSTGEHHALQLVLSDTQGRPASGWTYRLYEQDTQTLLAEGALDARGQMFAEVAGDTGVEVEISPPALPSEATTPIESDWFQAELLNRQGQPARGWRYRIYDQSTTLMEGSLSSENPTVVQPDSSDSLEIEFFAPEPPERARNQVAEADELTWFRIQLVDNSGQLAAHWSYEIYATGSDEVIARDRLDEYGAAVVALEPDIEAIEASFEPPLD